MYESAIFRQPDPQSTQRARFAPLGTQPRRVRFEHPRVTKDHRFDGPLLFALDLSKSTVNVLAIGIQ